MLNILYAGSPAASAETLQILLNESLNCSENSRYKICAVLTNPPSAKGRHKDLIPTEVAQVAQTWNEAHGDNIKILTPEHLDSALREELKPLELDMFVCFAYGHIFGPKFLDSFPLGGINLHPSLLPKYRGCTPVNAAILAGDKETGFSIQKMSLGVDEGDLLVQKTTALTGTETAESLLDYFAKEGASSIAEVLRKTAENKTLPEAVPQSGEATYCPLIKKEDGKINWSDSAEKIDSQIRAYTPWPGCVTNFNGNQLKIIKATAASKIADEKEIPLDSGAVPGTVLSFNKKYGILIQCGSGILAAKELQVQGKKAMDYKSFMNGTRDFIGSVLE